MITACHFMEESTGIRIDRMDVSGPQRGKDPCNRKAATIKAHVRRFINEGHDVTTAEGLEQAILSNCGVRGVCVAVVDAAGISAIQGIKLPGINLLNNYKYDTKNLTVWKAYEVGKGKPLEWSKQQGTLF